MVGSGKKAVSRPEGPRAGVGSWRGGNHAPPNQLENSPVGSGAQPKLNVWSWRGGQPVPTQPARGLPSGVW